MDDIYIKVKLEKKVTNDKIKYIINYIDIAKEYKKHHKKAFNLDSFCESKVWNPKEGYHVLGYATKRVTHLGETDDFKKELRAKKKHIFNVKDEMTLNKTRYEEPNLKYLKKEN
jgi:hypothetical protein